MTYTREGRSTGEAYVEMSCEEDIEKALKKHNEHLGPRYIEGSVYLVFLNINCSSDAFFIKCLGL